CNANQFSHNGTPLPSAGIYAYLREPLSGTMNTTEATVFRRPTVPASKGVLGGATSQETGVGASNPLKDKPCGLGFRSRAIGTGEEVTSVLNSQANHGMDGIGYAFFSYGNVKPISNNANYGYITVNGVDPIFQTYGSGYDPGQPAGAGVLPAEANLPAGTCESGAASFPCSEKNIWKNGFSFPNVRNGTYRAWSLLRLMSNGTGLTNVGFLLTASQKYVVSTTP